MITRKLTKDDYTQFSEVSASAYIYNVEETEFVESVDNFGTFINNGQTLISQLECGFRENYYGNTTLKCAAIGGVASKPEYRRMGGVRKLFNDVFRYAYDNGAAVSILYPFSNGYYRLFGYETVLRCISAECSFKTFEKIERYNDVTLATEENKDSLIEIYKAMAPKYNMMFTRPNGESFCFTPYKNCCYTYFLNDEAHKGYVTFTLDRSSRKVTVTELLFADKCALLRLMGFIKVFDGNYDFVVFSKLPVSSPVFEVIADENRLVKRSYLYEGQARIINMQKVLEAAAYPKEQGVFSIKINDDQISENNGIYTVDYKDGKATILKDSVKAPDLEMDINTASRVILGREGLTSDELVYLNSVVLDGSFGDTGCEAFLKAFFKKTTMFYDIF
ncbi:MAG: GNAT family N-acetyltransferase [Clostridia bacterium]|nr:GNAT family N-acetyltransferase [Clostridia bacterium]